MIYRKQNPTRRYVLRGAAALGGAAITARARVGLAQIAGADGSFVATPGQILGPVYPVQKPADRDADLTVIKGRSGRAQGQVIEIAGRVMTPQGTPVPEARIEIWQANTHGRYTHPSTWPGTSCSRRAERESASPSFEC